MLSKDKELKNLIKGVYVVDIGTKGSCFTDSDRAELSAIVTRVLRIKYFDVFTVDAAVELCTTKL